jgi:hypothetical protein
VQIQAGPGFAPSRNSPPIRSTVARSCCPRCHKDLIENVRGHLSGCATLPSEVRLRAQAVREAAQRLVKHSQELRDNADVLIREAEAALFESQEALRAAVRDRIQS